MQLLIVESPTKATTLQTLLGPDYRVRATGGHIYDLPDDALGIDLEETFEAQWKTAQGQRNVLAGLRRDAQDCEGILLATDPDREGEAIAGHLAEALARTHVPTRRIAFSEVTPTAVRAAVAKPRLVDARLVAAQQARRVVDRLVGYSVTPHLQRAVSSPHTLSAGRVQTAALRLVCERELAIADYDDATSWHVDAEFETADGQRVHARLVQAHGQRLDADTLDEGASRHLAEHTRAESFAVRSVRQTTESIPPPPPLITASLLRAASDEHGLRPAETLRVAQELYEGVEFEGDERIGLLTYPRTDSPRLSASSVTAIRGMIARDFGTDYLPDRPITHASARRSQNAHEAIRPTDFERSPRSVRKYLTPTQYRVYRLAYDRAVASQMAPASLEKLAVDVADRAGRFVFRTEGSRVASRGFLQLVGSGPDVAPLPPRVAQGDAVRPVAICQTQAQTTPPERYSEADLVGALESHGIGRPSTYAATLGTLQSRGYVVLKDRRLHATDLGLRTSAFLTRRFPILFDLGFTAQLEATLDAVAEGRVGYTPTLHQFYHGRLVPELERAPASITRAPSGAPLLEASPQPCERCGRPMVRRTGPHGDFLGCSNFPTCRQARPIVETTGVACPTCHTGHLVARTSKRGTSFYGCSRFPSCRHTQTDLAATPSAS